MTKKIVNTNPAGIIDNGQLMHYEFTDVEKTLETVHGEKYHKYREEWNKASNLQITPSRPLYVVIETNSYCNMNCKMCFRNFQENPNRKPENIDLNMLNALLEECKSLGVPSLCVGAASECLINPDIKKILTAIKIKGGQWIIFFSQMDMN